MDSPKVGGVDTSLNHRVVPPSSLGRLVAKAGMQPVYLARCLEFTE